MLKQQSESFAFCTNSVGSGYTEVIKTLTISEQSLGALSEQTDQTISGLTFSNEVYYIEENPENLKILSSGDMSRNWESFPILIKAAEVDSTQTFESLLYPQFYQGYIAVKWESTDTTGCMIALEYSIDDIEWWTWAELEITGHAIGKFIFGVPKINKFHLERDYYFKFKFKSSETSSGTIDASYVPVGSMDNAVKSLLKRPVRKPVPTPTKKTIKTQRARKPKPTPTPTPLEKEFRFQTESKKEWSVPFPDFNYDPSHDFKFDPDTNEYIDEEGNVVRILSSGCSIPCEEAEIEVTFDGCCMLDPTGTAAGDTLTFSFTAAKSGSVNVTAPDSAGCADIRVFINGLETKSRNVDECEDVEVMIVAQVAEGQDEECCEFCSFVSGLPDAIIPECGGATPLIKRTNKSTGENKILINKKYFVKNKPKKT